MDSGKQKNAPSPSKLGGVNKNKVTSSGISRALKPIKAITMFSPASFVAKFTIKIGWNLTKFIGKKLWSGVKKLAFGLVGLFAGLL